MTTIYETTLIEAPISRCFELSLDIDLEAQAVSSFGTRAVSGVTTGIIRAGQRATWKSRQFGMWVTHQSEITGFDEPHYFQDSMVMGLFRSFQHDHFFRSVNPSTTEMRDELSFNMPLWLFGVISERVLVKGRLTTLLQDRNILIKSAAEKAP